MKLPYGIADFHSLITDGYAYVDRTAYIRTMEELQGRKVYEECLILGEEVLVGQTALEKTDLQVDCRSRTLRPNPKHLDRPVMPVRATVPQSSADASPGAGR